MPVSSVNSLIAVTGAIVLLTVTGAIVDSESETGSTRTGIRTGKILTDVTAAAIAICAFVDIFSQSHGKLTIESLSPLSYQT